MYGRTVALRGVSLHAESGESVALVGENGSGKTTLLKVAAGAVTPTAGTISVFGKDLRGEPRAARASIGLLASESYLYDDLTARENMRFASTMAGCAISSDEIHARLRAVRLASHADGLVRTFSSGMKRRLSIARIQMLRRPVLLLDEPHNSLDRDGVDAVDTWIRTVTGEGGIALIATHDVERLTLLVDRVVRLERGTVTFSGSTQEYREAHAIHVG